MKLICPINRDVRHLLIDPILSDNPNFSNLSPIYKITYLRQLCQHDVISYVPKAWQIRSSPSRNTSRIICEVSTFTYIQINMLC